MQTSAGKTSMLLASALLATASSGVPLFTAPSLSHLYTPRSVPCQYGGSGRRRKPHNRGRCTRATPSGVPRGRDCLTRSQRRRMPANL